MAVVIAAPAEAAAPAAAAPAYAWPNLTDFLRQLVARIGTPVKVYRLVLDSDGEAELCVQDQDTPDLVDCYDYAAGAMQGPVPVKFDPYPSVAAIDHHVIALTEIDFSRLPAMLDRARAELGLRDGRLTGVSLERGDSGGFLSYTGIPIWTLRLDNRRHDGTVQFDLRGKVLHVDKD